MRKLGLLKELVQSVDFKSLVYFHSNYSKFDNRFWGTDVTNSGLLNTKEPIIVKKNKKILLSKLREDIFTGSKDSLLSVKGVKFPSKKKSIISKYRLYRKLSRVLSIHYLTKVTYLRVVQLDLNAKLNLRYGSNISHFYKVLYLRLLVNTVKCGSVLSDYMLVRLLASFSTWSGKNALINSYCKGEFSSSVKFDKTAKTKVYFRSKGARLFKSLQQKKYNRNKRLYKKSLVVTNNFRSSRFKLRRVSKRYLKQKLAIQLGFMIVPKCTLFKRYFYLILKNRRLSKSKLRGLNNATRRRLILKSKLFFKRRTVSPYDATSASRLSREAQSVEESGPNISTCVMYIKESSLLLKYFLFTYINKLNNVSFNKFIGMSNFNVLKLLSCYFIQQDFLVSLFLKEESTRRDVNRVKSMRTAVRSLLKLTRQSYKVSSLSFRNYLKIHVVDDMFNVKVYRVYSKICLNFVSLVKASKQYVNYIHMRDHVYLRTLSSFLIQRGDYMNAEANLVNLLGNLKIKVISNKNLCDSLLILKFIINSIEPGILGILKKRKAKEIIGVPVIKSRRFSISKGIRWVISSAGEHKSFKLKGFNENLSEECLRVLEKRSLLLKKKTELFNVILESKPNVGLLRRTLKASKRNKFGSKL